MDESILEEDGSSSSIFDSPFCFCLSIGIWLHPDLADELGINYEIKKLSVGDVLEADESFFSGTAAEVVPINSLDGDPIGSGSRGPITERLQSTYFDQVRGVRDSNSSWHTYIK